MSNGADAAKLKGLISRKGEAEEKIDTLSYTRRDVEQEIAREVKKYKRILKGIESLTVKDTIVSEHAILRYIERVMLVDLDEIKCRILSDDVISGVKNFGNGKFPVSDGVRAVAKGNVIVTVEVK